MSFKKLKFPKLPFTERDGKPYILPTLYGIGYLFLIVNIFALGYYRDNAPYHTVGLTLIVFGVVAMIHTNANIQNIKVKVDHCEPSEAGDIGEVHLLVQCLGSAPSHNLIIELDKNFQADQAMLKEVSYETKSRISVRSNKRGIYPVARVKVASKGLYGLFRAWSWHHTEKHIVVYPNSKGNHPLPSGMTANTAKELSEISRKGREGEDFQGHRPFTQGESLQHVDWKAYARGQDLLIKEYSGQGSEPLDLNWQDTNGDTEERLEQLSSWIAQMNRSQREYSLHIPGTDLSRASGTAQDEAAYFALAAYEES